MAEFEIAPGLKVVDTLRALQTSVDLIDDPSAKENVISKVVAALGFERVVSSTVLIEADEAFIHDPDGPPNELEQIRRLSMVGKVVRPGWIFDEDVPLDCITFNLQQPSSWLVEEDKAEELRRKTLHVPVLAITHCLLLKAKAA